MNKAVQIAGLIIALLAVPCSVQIIERSGKGQSNISESVHKKYDMSVKEGIYRKEHTDEVLENPSAVPDKTVKPKIVKPVVRREARYQEMLADAWDQYNAGKYTDALDLFSKVSERTNREEIRMQAYLGQGYSLKTLGKNRDAKNIFEFLAERNYRPEETMPVLMDLALTAGDRLSAERYLDRLPDNADMRSIIAWHCFEMKDYQCSLKHFTMLVNRTPGQDYLKGAVYSLVNMDKPGEALKLLDRHAALLSGEMLELKYDLYYQAGEGHYRKEGYSQAEAYLLRALEIKPGDSDAGTLLAWTYFNQGKYEKALPLFRGLYLAERSEEAGNNYMLALDKVSDSNRSRLMSELADEEDHALRKLAAEWFYKNNAPIKAASLSEGENVCYANCDTPALELSGYLRNKTGDEGLSKLQEISFPVRFHYPVSNGDEWIFSITPISLDSGSAGAVPYAGHYFRHLNDNSSKRRSLTDSVEVFEPEIRFRREGLTEKELMIGTTPLKGIVDPAVRFLGRIKKKDRWNIEIHQESVRESILSYVGLEDPYGDDEWGRVLKTGISGGMTYPIASPYWISFNAGYDYYHGENIIKNYSIHGTISAGKTFEIWKGTSSLGLFFTAKHFQRNSNFFTYGHGGYFSPDTFYLAGPFASYKTRDCCDFWVDGEISAGYMNFKTDSAPHYHKVNDDPSAMNAGAIADLSGRYAGEKKSGIGINARLKVLKLVRNNVALGAYMKENSSSDFNEFEIGLLLHYYFEPMQKLCHTWDIFDRK